MWIANDKHISETLTVLCKRQRKCVAVVLIASSVLGNHISDLLLWQKYPYKAAERRKDSFQFIGQCGL